MDFVRTILEKDEKFDREYVVHGDGEYADDTVHVNIYESHGRASDAWLSPHRGISNDRLTQHLRAFQLSEKSTADPDEKRSNTPSKHSLKSTMCYTSSTDVNSV